MQAAGDFVLVRHQMSGEGRQVINRGPERSALNADGIEFLDDRQGRLAQPYGVEPVNRISMERARVRRDAVIAGEAVLVPAGDLTLLRAVFGELFQLRDADRSRQVGEAVIEPDLVVEEFQRARLGRGTEVLGSRGQCGVVGEYGSAASGGDDLVAVEAGADPTPGGVDTRIRGGKSASFIAGPNALGSVLD